MMGDKPVVVDMFCGSGGEIVKQIGNAVCPKMAEALTAGYMRELAGAEA